MAKIERDSITKCDNPYGRQTRCRDAISELPGDVLAPAGHAPSLMARTAVPLARTNLLNIAEPNSAGREWARCYNRPVSNLTVKVCSSTADCAIRHHRTGMIGTSADRRAFPEETPRWPQPIRSCATAKLAKIVKASAINAAALDPSAGVPSTRGDALHATQPSNPLRREPIGCGAIAKLARGVQPPHQTRPVLSSAQV